MVLCIVVIVRVLLLKVIASEPMIRMILTISLHVVHKESLRLFLALSAHLHLRVHQADVKAAFLQAPLTDRIFMQCPPGYASRTDFGEEEILELSQAIYVLWAGAGFRSVLGGSSE